MKIYSTITLATIAFTALAQPVFAQSTTAADPACIITGTDGAQTIDKVKCPDGLKPGAAATETVPPTDSTTTNSTTTTDSTTEAAPVDQTTTGSTSAAPAVGNDVIVPADRFRDAKVMTASDFIGKRVYTKAGEDIGEVNDLIVTNNGAVQAVILGVGGFLGIGEKDVAVTIQSIEMQMDGNSTKLVVDASKDQLTNAPVYDRAKRTYVN